MMGLARVFVMLFEGVRSLVTALVRLVVDAIEILPHLPAALRLILIPSALFVLVAAFIAYPFAALRGYFGARALAPELDYAGERWLATAIYDGQGHFAGIFDPRLDSQRDVNFTANAIVLKDEGYEALPDHKSIPVKVVPQHFWACVKYHEDRRLGTVWNPSGIDFLGVLKIPYSTITRSVAAGQMRLGVGGSTLPMQLTRAVLKTPPRADETPFEKLSRKFDEWWTAPAIYWHLTRGGNIEPLQRWVADHLPLAQRTGGQPLYGVEQTARVIFGKGADELSIAEEYVLAAAVNAPISLLPGSDRLNAVRMSSWRRITETRAKACAVALLTDDIAKLEVLAELAALANGPPDPKVPPSFDDTLRAEAPQWADRARANPVLRANILIPEARYGAREELKTLYGLNWREAARGVHLSLDASANLSFRKKLLAALEAVDKQHGSRLDPGYALSPERAASSGGTLRLPDVIVAAADRDGRIVRYFEANDTASYFGSVAARDGATGGYDPARESRAIASVGKMIAAIALANEGRDTLATPYFDREAPATGLESCARGGTLERNRTAQVVFACSLNGPLEGRLARYGQRPVAELVRTLGFRLTDEGLADATPPTTAVVRGLIAGSPRTVHHMAAVITAAIAGDGGKPVPQPSLMRSIDRSSRIGDTQITRAGAALVPDEIIDPGARRRLREFLSQPLCYEYQKVRHGTLKSLADWCAARRTDLRFHVAKTGTHVGSDADATIDVLAAGGLQFTTGEIYSYVVVVGTGGQPFARNLHSAQLAAPLVRVLLEDLTPKAPQTTGEPPLPARKTAENRQQ